jgi:twinkle protein
MIIDQTEIERLIAKAETALELESVISTGDLADRILAAKERTGAPLPWSGMSAEFALRPGELTIWAGDNGSGKSLVVGQVMAWVLGDDNKVLIASMEMTPEETVGRICAQTAGCEPSEQWIRDWCAWADQRLWIYDRLETVAADHVLSVVRAVSTELGVSHAVIDSLVKCGVVQDGQGYLTAQTAFVDSLQRVAKHYGIHIHLIAHTRKPEAGSKRISKHDIRGASQITDLADNVVLVARNRGKEAAKAKMELGMPLDLPEEKLIKQPDCWLDLVKQRHHSFEGRFGFDFHKESKQWVPVGMNRAMRWGDI